MSVFGRLRNQTITTIQYTGGANFVTEISYIIRRMPSACIVFVRFGQDGNNKRRAGRDDEQRLGIQVRSGGRLIDWPSENQIAIAFVALNQRRPIKGASIDLGLARAGPARAALSGQPELEDQMTASKGARPARA